MRLILICATQDATLSATIDAMLCSPSYEFEYDYDYEHSFSYSRSGVTPCSHASAIQEVSP